MLLSSRSSRIVEATLSFVGDTISHSGSGHRLRLLSANIVSGLFVALQSRLDSVPTDQKIEDGLIFILASLLELPELLKKNSPPQTFPELAVFDKWFKLGVEPSRLYLLRLSQNGVSRLFTLQSGTFTALLKSLLLILPFDSSPLDLELYIPFALCFFNSFTLPYPHQYHRIMFKHMNQTLPDWKKSGGQVALNGREAFRRWQNEGLEDIIEKHLTQPLRINFGASLNFIDHLNIVWRFTYTMMLPFQVEMGMNSVQNSGDNATEGPITSTR
ncbi:hypothetical protein BLNAU_17315 [Blattamonas nauphoetae]|uniref:Uncharacterized protein n=1 Tax=Blattamonas nauphoetae TaxID=2049346 RepID=A0ABQ9X918_9EUKA|nr:hypothetical protein BLNAU_17315 [Blattamonas nauphoetae]